MLLVRQYKSSSMEAYNCTTRIGGDNFPLLLLRYLSFGSFAWATLESSFTWSRSNGYIWVGSSEGAVVNTRRSLIKGLLSSMGNSTGTGSVEPGSSSDRLEKKIIAPSHCAHIVWWKFWLMLDWPGMR